MKIYILIPSFCLALLLTGCGTMIAGNLKATNDNWDIDIVAIKDGPNSVSQVPYLTTMPRPGFRFIWLTIQAKNNSNVARMIDLRKIGLISGQILVLPFHVVRDTWLNIPANNELTLDPNESARRRIVFMFPINIQPQVIRVPDIGDIPVELLPSIKTDRVGPE